MISHEEPLHEGIWRRHLPLVERPRTRGDCAQVPRPCPWIDCRYHLYIDADRHGGVRIPWPRPLEETPPGESCALDVAEGGSHSLREIAHLLNCTRANVGRVSEFALEQLRRHTTHLRFEGEPVEHALATVAAEHVDARPALGTSPQVDHYVENLRAGVLDDDETGFCSRVWNAYKKDSEA